MMYVHMYTMYWLKCMYVCTECVLGFGDVRMHIPKLLCGVKTIGHLCDLLWDISVLPVSVEVLAGFNGMPPLSEQALSLLNLVAHKASWDSTPFRLMNLTADLLCAIGVCDNGGVCYDFYKALPICERKSTETQHDSCYFV